MIFIEGDLLHYTQPADRVICIGVEHAWGGTRAAFLGLRERVLPKGKLLFGGGFWIQAPSPKQIEMFGELPGSLDDLVALARSTGWISQSTDTADQEEWDEFEATWNQDLDELAQGSPTPEIRPQALRLANLRREEYHHGYRGVLGFAYLILEKAGPTL